MKFAIPIITILALSACESSPVAKEDTAKVNLKRTKIIVEQLPIEGWDGKNLEYVIVVKFADLKGQTKTEAEKLKKFYVVNGLKKGIEFLFRLSSFDAGRFNVQYDGSCEGLREFPPKKWNIPELVIKEGGNRCKDMASRESSSQQLNGDAWESPERDINAKSFDALLKFGSIKTMESGATRKDWSPPDYDKLIDIDESTFFGSTKDEKNKDLPVLYFPSSIEKIGNQYEENNRVIDVDTTPHTGVYRNDAIISANYSIFYNVPTLGFFFQQKSNKKNSTIYLAIPNKKLMNIFQSSAPNVTPTFLEKVENDIAKKLEPYDLRLGHIDSEGGSALSDITQSEANSDLGGNGHIPKWLTDVDIEKGKEIWGYLMLNQAKIEFEKNKENNMVFFKITVNMDELLKSAKAEKYEKFMAK